MTDGKQIELIRCGFQEYSLKVLFQLVLSQRTERGTDSYFASQENFTPECMMPSGWVEKIDRTWVRDDCVAATPALGNFSSFCQRIKLFF